MLGHLLSRPGHHKRSEGGDVECILLVAPGPAYIDRVEPGKIHRHAELKQCIPESCKFLHRNAAHQIHRNKSCDLGIIVRPLCHISQDPLCILLAQGLMVEQIL